MYSTLYTVSRGQLSVMVADRLRLAAVLRECETADLPLIADPCKVVETWLDRVILNQAPCADVGREPGPSHQLQHIVIQSALAYDIKQPEFSSLLQHIEHSFACSLDSEMEALF